MFARGAFVNRLFPTLSNGLLSPKPFVTVNRAQKATASNFLFLPLPAAYFAGVIHGCVFPKKFYKLDYFPISIDV